MKKILLVLILSILIPIPILLHCQPTIEWAKCYGGSSYDQAISIKQTRDGGYIIAGLSNSNDSDVSGNHGVADYWIVKLNSIGGIEWQKSIGGSNGERANSIQQTKDEGYIVAGISPSNDGDVNGNHGKDDYWIVKLNSIGGIEWQKCLGGSGSDGTECIQQTNDSGYIIAGYSHSNDGDVIGNHGGYSDSWVVKLNSIGGIEWQKCFGGSGEEHAMFIQQLNDNGYIIAGISDSNDGDVSSNHGKDDYWIVKLNSEGSIQWQECLGGSDTDVPYSIQQTSDSGYILGGWTLSKDGDVNGSHGYFDGWIVKLNINGNIQWQKSIGGSRDDEIFSIQQTSDGGYIAAGWTDSKDGDVNGNHGDYDGWIVKFNSNGEIQWQKSLGGTSFDRAYSIQQTNDGGYIIAGNTSSNDGDVIGYNGVGDYWIVKLSSETGIQESKDGNDYDISITPNPAQDFIIINNIRQFSSDNIQIFNLLGNVVKNIELQNMESQQINISDLVQGVYFIKINKISRMFIKE